MPLTTIQKDKIEKITSSCCYITFISLYIIMHFYDFKALQSQTAQKEWKILQYFDSISASSA